MKKPILLIFSLLFALQARAWWDPGHMVTAMIAYLHLDETARARVDALTKVLERDYPQVNHFIATGPWPDDLKADGVRAYDTWHYANLTYNPDGVALPDRPEGDIIQSINDCISILGDRRAKEIDKARFLGFLVHFVSDLHQPLHSTSMFNNELPGGNQGGNKFLLAGNWRNLHALWDDGCGYLTEYNDIRPYGQPKAPLTEAQIARIRTLAEKLIRDYPESQLTAADTLDPDFWALESHKLVIRYAYRAVKGKDDRGRNQYLAPDDEPTPYYLEQVQEVVRRQLALSGYRLARMLNELFGESGKK